MTMFSRTPLALAAACAGALALLAPAAPASAANPHQLDPAQMVPALNPDFAPWSCFEAGRGITCQGGYTATYEGVGTSLFCAGEEVVVAGTVRERMTRWHDADGRATRTSVHVDVPADALSLPSAGADGPVVTVAGHFNRHYRYPVPGERSSRVLTEVGAIYLVRGPDGGRLLLHDTGTVTFAPGRDFEVVDSMSGRHDFYADQSSLQTAVCDALT